MIVRGQDLKDIAQSMVNSVFKVEDDHLVLMLDIVEVEYYSLKRWGWKDRLIKELQRINPGFVSTEKSDYFTLNSKKEVILNHDNFKNFPARSIITSKLKIVVPEDAHAMIVDRYSKLTLYRSTNVVTSIAGIRDTTSVNELRMDNKLEVSYIR